MTHCQKSPRLLTRRLLVGVVLTTAGLVAPATPGLAAETPPPQISAETTVTYTGDVSVTSAETVEAQSRADVARAQAVQARKKARKLDAKADAAKHRARTLERRADRTGSSKDARRAVEARQVARKADRKSDAAKRAARKAESKAAIAAASVGRSAAPRNAVAEPPSAPVTDSHRSAVLGLVNRARDAAGCAGLKYSATLERSAQSHTDEMAEYRYMSHTSRSGKTSDERIRSFGFDGTRTGENLGAGFSAAQSVFDAWMHSPGHRDNILGCKFKLLGVGYSLDGGYWVQHFGG